MLPLRRIHCIECTYYKENYSEHGVVLAAHIGQCELRFDILNHISLLLISTFTWWYVFSRISINLNVIGGHGGYDVLKFVSRLIGRE